MKKTRLLLIAFLTLLTIHSQAQYCLLPGRTTYSAEQPGITNFKLNTIDRTSGSVEQPLTEGQITVSGDTTELALGKTYTVELTHTRDATFFPTARNNIRLWVDYNQNEDFTDNAETAISEDYQAYGTFTGTFTVPMDAKLGYTRLRATAKMSDDAGHTVPTPCDEPKDPLDYHGEMEDYVVKIVQFPTSINTASADQQISVAPNPTNGLINISLSNEGDNIKIVLSDLTGKVIATPIEENIQTSNLYTIDMNTLVQTQGVYLLKITSGNTTTYKKVIKTN